MTRILLLYLMVAAIPSLAYVGFVWWRAWQQNRKEDRIDQRQKATTTLKEPPPAIERAEPHDFGGTELSYSLDEPEGSRLLQRLAPERRSLLNGEAGSKANTSEKPDYA